MLRWLQVLSLFVLVGCCSPGERAWQLDELAAGRLHDCAMDSGTIHDAWGNPDSVEIERKRSSLSRGSSRERFGLEEYVVWTYTMRNRRLTFKDTVLIKHERIGPETLDR